MAVRDRLKAELASLLRKLPPPLHQIEGQWMEYKTRKELRKRYLDPKRSQRASKPKVFGIGLSKTATSSLHTALNMLGYNAVHRRRGGKIVGWTEFRYFDAVTDINTSTQFESLYYSFNNSKFIYTTRNIDDWDESIEDHFT